MLACLGRFADGVWLVGFVAGSCTGLWKRNGLFGFNMGMLGGILAWVRKEMLVQGWDIVPKDHQVIRRG